MSARGMSKNSLSENGVALSMCPEVAIQYGQNHGSGTRLKCGTCSALAK